MKHASLFSGIGGFDLAAEWMNWQNIFSCEYMPFPQSILKHYFSSSNHYGDIRELDGTKYRGTIDVLTGGFPCQPFSAAGRRRGTEDNRFLWPEMLRVIREIEPTWIVAENVRGIVSIDGGLVFERVHTELEANGYEVQAFCIPACAVGAPHKRERMWFIANRNGGRLEGSSVPSVGNVGTPEQHAYRRDPIIADGACIECERRECGRSSGGQSKEQIGNGNSHAPDSRCERRRTWSDQGLRPEGEESKRSNLSNGDWSGKTWHETATRLCRVDDGLSRNLDGITVPRWRRESLKAYGNAIVPQIAYQIFQAIELASQ